MATDAKGSIASSPLELTLGSIVTDNISSSSDVDYFKLPQVTSASKLTLDFTGLSSTTNDNEFIISVKNASDTTVATTTKGLSTTLNAAMPPILTITSELKKELTFLLPIILLKPL